MCAAPLACGVRKLPLAEADRFLNFISLFFGSICAQYWMSRVTAVALAWVNLLIALIALDVGDERSNFTTPSCRR